jgi:hypothetical protein
MRAGSLRVHATHYIVPHRLAIQVNFAECHMKSIFGMSLVAAAGLGAAMFAGAPAEARTDFSISIGVPNAIQYDYGSGGYCDSYGCPDGYWDFPVWYGPVYWHGTWYRGPVYYRDDFGRRQYWIAGGWHHDQWRGSRPDWWSRGHYYAGPALGYDYYRGHGFRHNRDRHWHGDNWRSDRRGGYNGGGTGINLFFGGKDHHDRDDHDRDRHHDRDRYDNHGGNHGIVTTTMSPGAAFNASTGGRHHDAAGRGPAVTSAPAATSGGSEHGDHKGSSGGDHHDHKGSGSDDRHHHH